MNEEYNTDLRSGDAPVRLLLLNPVKNLIQVRQAFYAYQLTA